MARKGIIIIDRLCFLFIVFFNRNITNEPGSNTKKKLIAHLLIGIFFILSCKQSHAQLCIGSLGDPVVNINFGSGLGTGPALSPGTTNYIFSGEECPVDGSYAIVNASSCGSGWQSVKEDHTAGDVNGYMMFINASYDPGIFYQQTVSGLCENTTYEFASWILNLLNTQYSGHSPNITFSVESLSGTVLQTYNTGDILSTVSPVWNKYGLYFTTPAGITSVVIRMVNNAPGGPGNDLLLDDISFRPCGPLVTATINGFGDSVQVCKGDTTIFLLTSTVSTGYNNPTLQWQVSTDSGMTWSDITGANSYSYVRLSTQLSGVYKYRLAVSKESDLSCKIHSRILTITVADKKPTANAGPDKTIVKGQSVILNGIAGVSDYSYWWTPDLYMSSPHSLTPLVSPPVTSIYILHVKSNEGCGTATDTVKVDIYQNVYVPTAFTPNSDGLNDVWKIMTLATYPEAEVKVFNRWGQLVYNSNGGAVIWDGKYVGALQPAGVYCYFVDFKNGLPVLKGVVALLR